MSLIDFESSELNVIFHAPIENQGAMHLLYDNCNRVSFIPRINLFYESGLLIFRYFESYILLIFFFKTFTKIEICDFILTPKIYFFSIYREVFIYFFNQEILSFKVNVIFVECFSLNFIVFLFSVFAFLKETLINFLLLSAINFETCMKIVKTFLRICPRYLHYQVTKVA